MIRINPFVTYFLLFIYLFYLFVRSARKTQIAHKLSSAVFFNSIIVHHTLLCVAKPGGDTGQSRLVL